MTVEEIAALPVGDLAGRDCALFLWVCWPTLLDSIRVIEAWGFAYKTCAFSWTKTRVNGGDPAFGMGYWTRANNEVCLLATRGSPRRLSAGVPQAVLAPRREHSRKPDVHAQIEQLVGGPYVELFARARPRRGWRAWGDEVGRFG
jgi:N6-adenosine-specific RNA methylase IME4